MRGEHHEWCGASITSRHGVQHGADKNPVGGGHGRRERSAFRRAPERKRLKRSAAGTECLAKGKDGSGWAAVWGGYKPA